MNYVNYSALSKLNSFVGGAALNTNKGGIVFYTVIGQEVFKMQISKNVNFIQGNLPQLPLGIYSYKIISGNTCIKNGKLIVK